MRYPQVKSANDEAMLKVSLNLILKKYHHQITKITKKDLSRLKTIPQCAKSYISTHSP